MQVRASFINRNQVCRQCRSNGVSCFVLRLCENVGSALLKDRFNLACESEIYGELRPPSPTGAVYKRLDGRCRRARSYLTGPPRVHVRKFQCIPKTTIRFLVPKPLILCSYVLWTGRGPLILRQGQDMWGKTHEGRSLHHSKLAPLPGSACLFRPEVHQHRPREFPWSY